MTSHQDNRSRDEIRRRWKIEQKFYEDHKKRKQAEIEKFERNRKMSERRRKDSHSKRSSRSEERKSSSSSKSPEPVIQRSAVTGRLRALLEELEAGTSKQREDTTSQLQRGDQQAQTSDQRKSKYVPKSLPRSHERIDTQPSTSATIRFAEPSAPTPSRNRASSRDRRRTSSDRRHTSSDRRRTSSHDRRRTSSRDRRRTSSRDRRRSRSQEHGHRSQSRSDYPSRCPRCDYRHYGYCRERPGYVHDSQRPSRSGNQSGRVSPPPQPSRTERDRASVQPERGHPSDTSNLGQLTPFWMTHLPQFIPGPFYQQMLSFDPLTGQSTGALTDFSNQNMYPSLEYRGQYRPPHRGAYGLQRGGQYGPQRGGQYGLQRGGQYGQQRGGQYRPRGRGRGFGRGQ